MNITDFLLARIAEDERAAREATAGPWNSMTEETGDGDNIYYTVEHDANQLLDMNSTGPQGRKDAEYIARNNPARVLAECEAKRAIIEECSSILNVDGWEYDDAPDLASLTLGALATIYAGHRDYGRFVA